jgi:hypothetical protein
MTPSRFELSVIRQNPEPSWLGVQGLLPRGACGRAWTIQLVCEDKNPGDATLKEFARLAQEDLSPVIREHITRRLTAK